MPLVHLRRNDVAEQAAEQNEERLGSEGEHGQMLDVAGGQSLSDALAELPLAGSLPPPPRSLRSRSENELLTVVSSIGVSAAG